MGRGNQAGRSKESNHVSLIYIYKKKKKTLKYKTYCHNETFNLFLTCAALLAVAYLWNSMLLLCNHTLKEIKEAV